MSGQKSISLGKLRAILVVAGLACLGNIYYHLHIAPGWQWGPAIDKMPRHVVTDFRTALYDERRPEFIAQEYLSANAQLVTPGAVDPAAPRPTEQAIDLALFPEFDPAATVTSELQRPLMGDGRQVTAVHTLTVNGVAQTVVDVVNIGARGGRIDSIQRYVAQN